MIQSLLRSMELLEVLKEQNRNFSIAELSESMNLPPSTIHRILQTFCEKKYVIRDDRSHTYRLGPALIPLGKAAARGIRLQDAAHPVLKSLSCRTKEDSYLVIPVENKGLVIEKVDGPIICGSWKNLAMRCISTAAPSGKCFWPIRRPCSSTSTSKPS